MSKIDTVLDSLQDGWPGEFFGVDIGSRGEDITMIRLRGVKGDGAWATRQPYLDGKTSFDDAIAHMVSAL